ncbi:MAG: hypothetical protein ACP5RH_08025 [Leptodesmis sp.]
MQEYLANGLKLSWLLDPDTQAVEIYRPSRSRCRNSDKSS